MPPPLTNHYAISISYYLFISIPYNYQSLSSDIPYQLPIYYPSRSPLTIFQPNTYIDFPPKKFNSTNMGILTYPGAEWGPHMRPNTKYQSLSVKAYLAPHSLILSDGKEIFGGQRLHSQEHQLLLVRVLIHERSDHYCLHPAVEIPMTDAPTSF